MFRTAAEQLLEDNIVVICQDVVPGTPLVSPEGRLGRRRRSMRGRLGLDARVPQASRAPLQKNPPAPLVQDGAVPCP